MFGHAWLRAAETVALARINDRPPSPRLDLSAICDLHSRDPLTFRAERAEGFFFLCPLPLALRVRPCAITVSCIVVVG
jgi:hypothetical protein